MGYYYIFLRGAGRMRRGGGMDGWMDGWMDG
jgi:hypothetical protein